MKRTAFFLGMLLVIPAAPARAQDGPEDALAVVRRLFDAMRARDSVALRAVFHPEARLMTAFVDREGNPAVRVTPIDRFVTAVGGTTIALDERFWAPEVRVDGGLATVWGPYAFYADGKLDHCGIDAFQLALTTDGWKIIQIADTHRREACAGPPEGN
jgi:hypothetical protein